MNENYNNPDLDYFDDDEEEGGIDIIGIFVSLLKSWKWIGLVTFVAGCIGVGAALMMTKVWTVKTTIAPELQRAGSSNINNIASMLGFGGASMNNSIDALNVSIFPQISSSIPFLTDLFDVEVHPAVFTAVDENGNPQESTTIFKHATGKDKPLSAKKRRKREAAIADGTYMAEDNSSLNYSSLSMSQRSAVSYLSRSIKVSVSEKTGLTTVSVTMDDPRIATEVADTVLAQLQTYVIRYRTEKAERDLAYYSQMADEAEQKMIKAQSAYAAAVDYNRSAILQSVTSERERLRNEASLAQQLYSQMAQQRELAKAKVQEMKPVYVVIQPASEPLYPDNSRKKVVLMCAAAGFALVCAWFGFGQSLVIEMYKNIKSRCKEEDEEEEEAKEN